MFLLKVLRNIRPTVVILLVCCGINILIGVSTRSDFSAVMSAAVMSGLVGIVVTLMLAVLDYANQALQQDCAQKQLKIEFLRSILVERDYRIQELTAQARQQGQQTKDN